jgi:hypothetical protein
VESHGHEVWLEFDGLAGLREGLEAFVRGWAAARMRPKGVCFTVHAQGRDFASLMNWGPDAFTLPVPLGSFLLLRIDSDHPYFGDRTPGWLLVRPSIDQSQSPERIAWVPDLEEGTTKAMRLLAGAIIGP